MEDRLYLIASYEVEEAIEVLLGDIIKFEYDGRTRVVLVKHVVAKHDLLGGLDLTREGQYRAFKLARVENPEIVTHVEDD